MEIDERTDPDAEDRPEVVPDFIFGSLASDDLRVAAIRRERRGLWHDQRLTPRAPGPDDAVTITVAVGPDVDANRVTLYWSDDGAEPAGSRGVASHGEALAMRCVDVEWDTLLWGYRQRWEATIPARPAGTHVRYLLEAWHAVIGTSCWADQRGLDGRAQVFGYVVEREHLPNWFREAVIYHVFVDRYAPDPGASFALPADELGGFYGGTLRGVTSRLDEIAALGCTALWLSPIFPSPSHHGYDATDYGSVEPRLGSEEDFDTLVREAHARGVRVILDYTASHLSNEHPAFLAALDERDSEAHGWFLWDDWPHAYRTFFGVRSMPQIDVDHPAARRYLLDHAVRWVARGVDGFRLDYAIGPTHDFWSALRAATRAANPDSVTVGEAVATASVLRSYAGRMDGCLDFLLLQALRNFFSFQTLSVAQLDGFLSRHLAYVPSTFMLPSFLDNHDMNRFLWTAGNDVRVLKLAALCQFTLPGPPIVYYGTEVGMSQRRDVRHADGSVRPEEARRPMPVPGDLAYNAELRAFYARLIALRRARPADHWRARETLKIDDAARVYAYRCGDDLVAFNAGVAPASVPLPPDCVAAVGLVTDDGDQVEVHESRIVLPSLVGVCMNLAEYRAGIRNRTW